MIKPHRSLLTPLRTLLARIVAALSMAMISLPTQVEYIAAASAGALTHDNESPLACPNLDVVFIIDQSNSMSGADGQLATDPNRQRKFAPETMIDLLADNVLDLCPGAEHRIAVVSFANSERVDLELSNIAPENLTESLQLREALRSKLTDQTFGQTNPKPAFEKAAEILNTAAESGEAKRKRVILFLTDGVPCVAELGCTLTRNTMDTTKYVKEMRGQIAQMLPFDSTLLAFEQCMSPLRDQYGLDIPPQEANRCLGDYPADEPAYRNSTYIFVILLKSNQAYYQNTVNEYQGIAAQHAGRLIALSENKLETENVVREIIEDLLGVKASLISCGNFAVNPYLKKARLIIHKIDPGLKVSLSYTDKDGVKHEITDGQSTEAGGFDLLERYYAYGTNERYVFAFPYPGIWQLTADNCDGLDAFYDEIKINPAGYQPNFPSELPQYDRQPYYDAQRPFYVDYRMGDETGRVIAQADNPQFEVKMAVTITDPENKSKSYSMTWVPTERLFRSTEPLQIAMPGKYKIDILGTTYEHAGEPAPLVSESYSEVFNTPRELFRHEGVEFTVFPVIPFVIKVISPADGDTLRPIHGTLIEGMPLPIEPIPVRVQIVDRQGNPLDNLNEVLTDAQKALTAFIEVGEERSQIVTLSPDPDVTGGYRGEIPQFDAEGSQTLVVQLQSDFDDHYRPEERRVEVNFSRADYLWTRPVSYIAGLILLILAVAAAIVYNISIRTNKVTGTLVFRDATSVIARFPLNSGKNWAVIRPNTKSEDGRPLRDYLQLDLKRIKIENITDPAKSRRGRSAEPEGMLMESTFDSGGKRIRVSYVCSSIGGTKTVDLDENIPSDYSCDTVAQIVYEPLE